MDPNLPSNQAPPTQQPVPNSTAPAADPGVVAPKPQSISTPNKEFGPMTASSAPSEQGQVETEDDEEKKVAKQEVMLGQKVSPGKEVPLSEELKEAGVEQGADIEQEIPTVVQRAGMRVTSSDSLVPESHLPAVKLPINYAHAKQLDKRSKIKESIKWLARVIKRQWEKLKVAEKNPEPKQEI